MDFDEILADPDANQARGSNLQKFKSSHDLYIYQKEKQKNKEKKSTKRGKSQFHDNSTRTHIQNSSYIENSDDEIDKVF